MLKRLGLILVLLLCCLSLTACYDAVDINDLGYVTMLGLDFGTKDDWQFTFQYPEFEGGDNAGGGGSMKYATLVMESASFYTAVQLANTNLPKELNFMHLKTLVFSQELAESGELDKMLTSLIRFKQIRRTVNILICRGKAYEFVDAAKPYMGNLITDTLEELLGNSHTTGLLPEMPLNTFYNSFMSPYNEGVGILGAINKGDNLPEAAEAQKKSQEEGGGSGGDDSGGGDSGNGESKEKPSGEEGKEEGKEKEKDNKAQEGEKAKETSGDIVAGEVLRAGGNELEVLGSALFSKGKMVGSLTGFETQMMLMLRGELERSVFSMPDPEKEDYQVAIDIREFDTPQYKIRIEDGKPKIDVRVFLEGEIVSIQSRINYEDPDKQEPLKKAFEEYINKGLEQTIKKCQEKNTDVLSFGQRAANHFATIQDWENYKWNEKFSQAEIKTEVEFTVRRTGTMVDSYHVEGRNGLP